MMKITASNKLLALIKKKAKFSSYLRKFRWDRLQLAKSYMIGLQAAVRRRRENGRLIWRKPQKG
jgi:hypothetical protein